MAATGTAATTCFLRKVFQVLPLSQPLRRYPNLTFYGTPSSLPLITPRRNSGICHLAQAVKGEVNDVLKSVGDKNLIEEVKHILEMARRASSRREVLHTDFLTPPTVKEAMLVLEKLADIKAVAQGGHPQAERCRLSVGYPEALVNDPDIVAALSITGNFSFQPCSHGDFLGAILGTGISREKVGDILLQGEKGAQVILVPELVDFIMSSLDKVGNVSVSCARIPLLALEYEPPSSKDVRVNWITITKNNTTLKTGDIVSVSGKGRLEIGEIKPTKKGKFSVELIRYI
ncbi:uncharacterized protein [Euphorbia lathyris]|uniref:uncharacterized protein isoform X2 n=1 Tax=Euphorbia lathyris TaxID=212925 RepID=UPI0033142C08